MIQYNRFTLDNGLRVLVHEDESTPLACINLLYDVGARDENPEQTGFAHLFEHLMFGGSANIPVYDEPLQRAGGENNAFTSNDITNYYLTLPANNLETGFWLESDRMLELAFSPKSLEVQKNVVIEEFKERYLNAPYGDTWKLLRELCYKTHPYRWPTIGKETAHIADATLDDVKSFFYRFYRPNNAILCVAGNVKTEQVKVLAEKWFGAIAAGEPYKRNLPQEQPQTEARIMDVERKVPVDALYKAWHVAGHGQKAFYTYDLISDVLGRGESSRLKKALVKERKLFAGIDCYMTSDIDTGLLVVEGKLVNGVAPEIASSAIDEVLAEFCSKPLEKRELEKVKNKIEATHTFGEINILNRAMALCYSEVLGNANIVNLEPEYYRAITAEDVQSAAQNLFVQEKSNTLIYRSKQ